ncbi:MAG: LysE/ArgO family amino acid transporter [Pseudomonadota bacterium]
MTTSFVPGFFLGLSLIVAIGAQNAFVLRQGLRGEHVFAVALTCALSDALLIAIGVSGFDAITEAAPWLAPVMRYGGAAFLVVYGAFAFIAAFRGGETLQEAAGGGGTLVAALSTCLALTWLNPHVYLDTVVLLGSVAAQYPGNSFAFGLGAVTASFFFFFTLGYGAKSLRPFFEKPIAWRLLDFSVGLVMWSVALTLLIG